LVACFEHDPAGSGTHRRLALPAARTRFCRDPQETAQKTKSLTPDRLLLQWSHRDVRFEGRVMIESVRVNAILVALLKTASAVNGIVFYAYL
jgi:hypothetical protein